jgi:hypothetical protein
MLISNFQEAKFGGIALLVEQRNMLSADALRGIS